MPICIVFLLCEAYVLFRHKGSIRVVAIVAVTLAFAVVTIAVAIVVLSLLRIVVMTEF
jgi:hypothetical protein